MLDCLVVGGGIIGLAVADRLVTLGRDVSIVDHFPLRHQQQDGARTSSIAAGGILPPPISRATYDPLEQIRTLSDNLFSDWVRELELATGIKCDYRVCGGLYIARTIGEEISLNASADEWKRDGVELEQVSIELLDTLEPQIDFSNVRNAFRLPAEQLVHPASLVKALRQRSHDNGVKLETSGSAVRLELNADHAVAVVDRNSLSAREIIVAGGPWTTELLLPFGFDVGVEPRRGQIVKWQLPDHAIQHVVNEGPRYVFCRADGELIAGSTVEEVEFDCRTTDDGIGTLVEFAESLVPQIRDRKPVETWAGLRPFSRDGVPSIGRVAGVTNLTVATGHFRSGIHLAPATALLICQLLSSQSPAIDMKPFEVRRN
ncbi:MAG: FAD-dependent oxidoreductase [Planctomycetales bacterium]|nr:FAD-dependent oxidoreductase [Planctomycetales bacterium]